MSLFDRLGRVITSNLNDLVSKAEDPEKILEQAVVEMQENAVKMRQALATAIATQKKTELQYKKNQQQVATWQERAQLAISKGDETLAREALIRKKPFAEALNTLEIQLQQQIEVVSNLKRDTRILEGKIVEAKSKKDMLKARANAAKAQKESRDLLSGIDTSSSMSAFERMEDKVMQLEAESQVAGELEGGASVDEQFRQLEAGQDIEDELAMMKAQLPGAEPSQAVLPGEEGQSGSSGDTGIDIELEKLRSELKDN
ncbi:phage shock protein A (IM30), suppresses sigma54-dependent transcription [Xenococcus sp. PCC 7305]|uniref:PspA/IM30 family protein n=1 Tax=Xenococcus sp. PCC 7305 TaxID=102125 RepID=UPI0002AC25B6|nr:PspA/IM30 family protein [Xenococcus sp. PCC 7305]ELS04423.1 phage shock protein A (IM30), suppresses sigma54-dependent transcription [Xenococcus sp. PCC 7305]